MANQTEYNPSIDLLHFENIIKFLDVAIRTTSTKAKETPKLDAKLALQRELRRLDDARRILRLNYYAYEDYLKTGEYEALETKSLPVCEGCGQIKVL